jgi:murein DD-endopeptidase MepM/ murein hydrolase activator NlpD
VNRRQWFNVLVVQGDGARHFQFALPRWALYGGLTTILMALAIFGLLVSGFVELRSLRREVPALTRRLAEQQNVIATYEGRIDQIGLEVASWRDVHGRIWQSFRPAPPPGRSATKGLGGPGENPESDAASVPPGTGLEKLNGVLDVVKIQGEDLRALEHLMTRAGKFLASLPSRWPVRGAVNSEFGSRASPFSAETEFHAGMDIAVPAGTPVHAPAPGTVLLAREQGEYGLCVVIDHGQDVRTRYGHLSQIKVSAGDTVERGQIIGRSGSTGKSTGPHLHYELLVKDRRVNPRAYFWDDPVATRNSAENSHASR